MFKSAKRNMKLSISVKPFIKRDGTGAKEHGAPFVAKCYIEGGMQVITDLNGAEVVSSKRIYVDGAVPLNELDKIVLDGRDFDIKNLIPHYWRDKRDLWVVYL